MLVVPLSYASRVCAEFAQLGTYQVLNRWNGAIEFIEGDVLGARGVSVMFGSGDGGVGDGDPNPATQQCFSNDGRNVTMFIPEFPASCPL